MTQFKAGDKVRVVEPYGALVKGDVHTVDRVDGAMVYLTPYARFTPWFAHRFELVEPGKVEIGDTVEVTYDDGTRVSGVVSYLYSTSGSFDIGVDSIHYVSADDNDKVKIIEKVKKPKVWAVGDVVEGDDYASETILNGTMISSPTNLVVKNGGSWTDVQLSCKYPLTSLTEPRAIVYIPEVSA